MPQNWSYKELEFLAARNEIQTFWRTGNHWALSSALKMCVCFKETNQCFLIQFRQNKGRRRWRRERKRRRGRGGSGGRGGEREGGSGVLVEEHPSRGKRGWGMGWRVVKVKLGRGGYHLKCKQIKWLIKNVRYAQKCSFPGPRDDVGCGTSLVPGPIRSLGQSALKLTILFND